MEDTDGFNPAYINQPPVIYLLKKKTNEKEVASNYEKMFPFIISTVFFILGFLFNISANIVYDFVKENLFAKWGILVSSVWVVVIIALFIEFKYFKPIRKAYKAIDEANNDLKRFSQRMGGPYKD